MIIHDITRLTVLLMQKKMEEKKKASGWSNLNGISDDDKTCGLNDMNCLEDEKDTSCGLNDMNCLSGEDDSTCGLNDMNCLGEDK